MQAFQGLGEGVVDDEADLTNCKHQVVQRLPLTLYLGLGLVDHCKVSQTWNKVADPGGSWRSQGIETGYGSFAKIMLRHANFKPCGLQFI